MLFWEIVCVCMHASFSCRYLGCFTDLPFIDLPVSKLEYDESNRDYSGIQKTTKQMRV